jgi:hypothetical protein
MGRNWSTSGPPEGIWAARSPTHSYLRIIILLKPVAVLTRTELPVSFSTMIVRTYGLGGDWLPPLSVCPPHASISASAATTSALTLWLP